MIVNTKAVVQAWFTRGGTAMLSSTAAKVKWLPYSYNVDLYSFWYVRL